MLNILLEDRYKIIKLVHQGQDSQVYKALDTSTSGKVAIKIELSDDHTLILHEIQVLTDLYNMVGFPRILSRGSYKGKHYIILNYLGKSLHLKFSQLKSKFSLGCVLRIAEELLYRIESLHNAGYLHQDLNPENIATGYGLNWQSLFLIGYGLATKYLDSNNSHVQCDRGTSSMKNIIFSSVNTMNRTSYSRRDDIESIGYLLIYFNTGTLPWLSSKRIGEPQIKNLKELMINESNIKNCPVEFLNVIKYARCLEYEQTPDYGMLRAKFKDLAGKSKIIRAYDWTMSDEKMISRAKLDRSKTPLCRKTTFREIRGVLARNTHKNAQRKKKVMFGGFGDVGIDEEFDEKDEEECKKEICRKETLKSEDYPEMVNRDKIMRMRKDFLGPIE